jgi:hypothetical protein
MQLCSATFDLLGEHIQVKPMASRLRLKPFGLPHSFSVLLLRKELAMASRQRDMKQVELALDLHFAKVARMF